MGGMYGNRMVHGHDFLSSDQLQLFVAGLRGLPDEEVRKAKVLYLRNAISERQFIEEQMRSFGCIQVAFFLEQIGEAYQDCGIAGMIRSIYLFPDRQCPAKCLLGRVVFFLLSQYLS